MTSTVESTPAEVANHEDHTRPTIRDSTETHQDVIAGAVSELQGPSDLK